MGSLPVSLQVNGIVVDQRNPKHVFAAGPAGIFQSSDGGLSWTARNDGLTPANFTALMLNPQEPDSLFAMTLDGTLYRSKDGARSWSTVKTNAP